MRPADPLSMPLTAMALVEASAGTGKTFTITTLYVRLVLDGLEVPRILVVTYTKAATAELRERVRLRLRQAFEAFGGAPAADDEIAALYAERHAWGRVEHDRKLLLQALRSFDEAAITTIHGFCQRMLQEHAFESRVSFDAELVAEQDLLRDELVRDFWAERIATAPRWLVDWLKAAHVGFERLSKLARLAVASPDVPVVPEAASAVDVDRLLGAWRAAWTRSAELWHAERERILDALAEPGVLYKRPYASSRETFAYLDAELASPRPWIERRHDDARRLTPAELHEHTIKGRRTPRHAFFAAFAALLDAERALDAAARASALGLELDLVRYVRSEIDRRKERANVQSFDDLLARLARALAESPDLARRICEAFPAALIDEFQDTDHVQYAIFRSIYLGAPRLAAERGPSLFLIGDPKQAIYSFRGADVFTYMASRADARDGQLTLGVNWRSDPRLVAAVNALFGRCVRPFVFADIPFVPVAPRRGATDRLGGALAGAAPFEILVAAAGDVAKAAREGRIAEQVAAEIARLLGSHAMLDLDGGSRPIGPGDVAVLCRTNRQAKLTHEALRALGVPAVLYGDASVLDTAEAGEVERVLRAMAEPGDGAALRAALVTTLVGLGGADIEALRDDEKAWDDVVARFAALAETWRLHGFVAAFRRLLAVHDVDARLLGMIDGERRLTNVLHLGELLQNAAVEGHRGPLALVEWLSRMRHDWRARGELAAEAAQIRLESDARRVKLTTVHQAKGLEYPIVYCPFAWTAIFEPAAEGFAFHDPAAGDERRFDVGSAEREAHADLYRREELAESLRVLYVALTRARHRCSVVWARFDDGAKSALGYLLHRPATLDADADVRAIVVAVSARLASEESFRDDLAALARLAPDAIVVRDLPSETAVAYRAEPEVETIVGPRRAARVLDDGWGTSSFTRLAAAGTRISAPAEEGVDHDESEEEPAVEQGAREPTIVLGEFPRGARAGELLHEILERIDFAAAPGDIELAVAASLVGHGFAAGAWTAAVTAAIRGVLEAPLGGAAGPLRLRDVARERRMSEMEFLVPIADAGAGAGRGAPSLTPERLASVLRAHRAPSALPGYAERLVRLRFGALRGFLRGFVDLVFEHDGRWYVVDWKSNFLGTKASAYAPERLGRVMESHHYVLQYHLYAVALHRHLRARLPRYEPARHFGGVYYLFLRGMAPEHAPGTGIFHDRPDDALLGALSDLLHGAARAGRGRAR